jgi:hypothetical protein
MCNPNSSVANRRYRQAALQSAGLSSSASLLTQKLMGSMIKTSNLSTYSNASGYTPTTQSTEAEPSYEMSFRGYELHQPQQHPYNLLYQHPEEIKHQPASKTKRRRKPQKPGLTAKVRSQ